MPMRGPLSLPFASFFSSSLCSGNQISVVLWGEAALSFDAEEVLELSKTERVVVILVGTLIKTYDGLHSLSSPFLPNI